MKRLFTLLLIPALYGNAICAREYLETVNVDWWWNRDIGNIESASCLIEPKGFYAECTLILEFSTGGDWYEAEANLEIDMNFRLPENSGITDLFLWIEGVAERGEIYDRWTASLIYESIVQRRIDPAILSVVAGNEYNLKVFPLPPNGSRKIMIRYLTPLGNTLNGTPIIQIPMNILKLSYKMPNKFKIAFKGGDQYHSPTIREAANMDFSYEQDADFGACWMVNLLNLKNYSSISMSYEQANTDHLKLSTYTDDNTGDKYYQLVLNHINVFDVEQRRKAVFLIDFINANSLQYNKTNILDELETSIRNSYTEKDSFNILFSGLNSTYISDHWMCGHHDSVSAVFDGLTSKLLNDYSNLPTLLVDGINFIKNHGNTGALILVSSSNSVGENTEANALISDFIKAIGDGNIPIHIVDIDDLNYNYNEMHLIGGQYYRGNEYFYSRLSQLTVGEYHSIRNNSLPVMLEKVNHRTAGYFKSLEVFIQTQDGYAFSNYRLNASNGPVYNDEAFGIIGQFIGKPPFEITLFGQNSSDNVYFNCDTMTDEQINQADSVLKTIWSAYKIRELMGLEQNNQIVSQIINTSISERILCDYTAFLVLEPDFEIPDEIQDDSEILDDEMWWPTVSIEDKTSNMEVSLSNYPNPFSEKTTINYRISDAAAVNISIYNSLGQLIKVLIDESQAGGDYTLEVYGSDLNKGLYHCVLQVDGKTVKRLKLVVL